MAPPAAPIAAPARAPLPRPVAAPPMAAPAKPPIAAPPTARSPGVLQAAIERVRAPAAIAVMIFFMEASLVLRAVGGPALLSLALRSRQLATIETVPFKQFFRRKFSSFDMARYLQQSGQ